MRFLTTVLLLAATCAHAQYFTKPRAEQVFVKTNMLHIIKSNDLQGALICIDTNFMNLYSNLLTAAEIGNIVTSNINENVQSLVYGALGDFLTNYPHTYADSSGYQNFFATSTRTDSVINRDLRVDRDAVIGRNLTVAGTTTLDGNVAARNGLVVGTNLTVGSDATVGSNLGVNSNLTVSGTSTFNGPGTSVVVNSTLMVGAPESVSKTGVIVQVSYNESQVSTAADAGSTNRFASGVSGRFLESRYGTIRGGLDGAPAEVYPSWRMVYIGASSGTNPWYTGRTNLIPSLETTVNVFPLAATNAGAWVFPADIGWTNLYAPSRFGVSFSDGGLTVATGGLYRVSFSISSSNATASATPHGSSFSAMMWTNRTAGSPWSFASVSRRYAAATDLNDYMDIAGTRILSIPAGTVLYPGYYVRGTASALGSRSITTFYTSRIYVEWMPLPSDLVGGVSPTAPLYDAPVPTTQFNEASALQALQ